MNPCLYGWKMVFLQKRRGEHWGIRRRGEDRRKVYGSIRKVYGYKGIGEYGNIGMWEDENVRRWDCEKMRLWENEKEEKMRLWKDETLRKWECEKMRLWENETEEKKWQQCFFLVAELSLLAFRQSQQPQSFPVAESAFPVVEAPETTDTSTRNHRNESTPYYYLPTKGW